ncbi:hypothetical protein EYV94_27880 [Puteibacter caeruleilacunae]|nr:hypothetical protein EYV94_27880 [Puteibacter caeruleilacunae]
MDPMAEKYVPVSPYAYCYNEPIRTIDPDGQEGDDAFTSFMETKEAIEKTKKSSENFEKGWEAGNKLASAASIFLGLFDAGVDITELVSELASGNYGDAALSAIAILGGDFIKDTKKASEALELVNEAKQSGKKIRNSKLAGGTHPKTGVPFDENGFPDFSDNLYKGGKNDVMIKPTGDRANDFSAANKAAGYDVTPKGYTWHHHQNTGRMQLVETDVHAATGHTGGFALWDIK